MLPWAWKLTSYCKNFAHFVLLCFFGILLAQNLQHIGIFKIFHILIKAQQVLNFLTSREFQPANFLKKFLHLVHFEPQFSYKWVLIKKTKCKWWIGGGRREKVSAPQIKEVQNSILGLFNKRGDPDVWVCPK